MIAELFKSTLASLFILAAFSGQAHGATLHKINLAAG
jgi:hypothetical protein